MLQRRYGPTRDLNEYGPSKAPLPTFNRPLPSARLPFQRLSLDMLSAASSVAGMTSQVIAGVRRVLYIGDRPRSLKRPNERSIPMSNVTELVVNYLAAGTSETRSAGAISWLIVRARIVLGNWT